MSARNGAEANHSKPRAGIKKLPAYLQELGYEVAAFGKVSHSRHTADYGFDHFAFDGFREHQAIPAALNWLRERRSTRWSPLTSGVVTFAAWEDLETFGPFVDSTTVSQTIDTDDEPYRFFRLMIPLP
jgi:arylsulfatase A-like enzyme